MKRVYIYPQDAKLWMQFIYANKPDQLDLGLFTDASMSEDLSNGLTFEFYIVNDEQLIEARSLSFKDFMRVNLLNNDAASQFDWVFCLPMSWLVAHQVTLPNSKRQDQLSALPFILEDELLGHPSEYNFMIPHQVGGISSNSNQSVVYSVSTALTKAIECIWASRYNFELTALVPACIPACLYERQQEDQSLEVVAAIWKTDYQDFYYQDKGYFVPLDPNIDLINQLNPKPKKLYCFHDERVQELTSSHNNEQDELVSSIFQKYICEQTDIIAHNTEDDKEGNVNLYDEVRVVVPQSYSGYLSLTLQKVDQIKQISFTHKAPGLSALYDFEKNIFKKTLVFSLIASALLVSYALFEIIRSKQQFKAYQKASVSLYQDLFPADTRIVNLKVQTEQHRASIQGVQSDAFFWHFTDLVMNNIASFSKVIYLEQIQFDPSTQLVVMNLVSELNQNKLLTLNWDLDVSIWQVESFSLETTNVSGLYRLKIQVPMSAYKPIAEYSTASYSDQLAVSNNESTHVLSVYNK